MKEGSIMGSVLGKNITLTIFGESHGEVVGGTICGLPSGIAINKDFIREQMQKRLPNLVGVTTRREEDEVVFLSGVKHEHTNGNPLTIIIKNKDIHQEDYDEFARPSHGDYTNFLRHSEFGEREGGGFSSGRLTAPLVALGAIIIDILKSLNIVIHSNVPSETIDLLEEVVKNGDSLGAKVVTRVSGLPGGVGEPFFDSLESVLSHAIFSIPGVKGVSFGLGFAYENKLGSEVNDQFIIESGHINTISNHTGGIDGGYSNGNDIIINTMFKPTPSIKLPQLALNLKTSKVEQYHIKGRHDACIALRGLVAIDSLVAFTLLDMLIEKHGKEIIKQ